VNLDDFHEEIFLRHNFCFGYWLVTVCHLHPGGDIGFSVFHEGTAVNNLFIYSLLYLFLCLLIHLLINIVFTCFEAVEKNPFYLFLCHTNNINTV